MNIATTNDSYDEMHNGKRSNTKKNHNRHERQKRKTYENKQKEKINRYH